MPTPVRLPSYPPHGVAAQLVSTFGRQRLLCYYHLRVRRDISAYSTHKRIRNKVVLGTISDHSYISLIGGKLHQS